MENGFDRLRIGRHIFRLKEHPLDLLLSSRDSRLAGHALPAIAAAPIGHAYVGGEGYLLEGGRDHPPAHS